MVYYDVTFTLKATKGIRAVTNADEEENGEARSLAGLWQDLGLVGHSDKDPRRLRP